MSANKPSAILCGSKPGSIVSLSILRERGWDVRYVVVSRKMTHPWIAGETLEDAAKRWGIPVRTASEVPRQERVDFVISYMYRYRVKADMLAMAEQAAVNFHAAPLPEFGGWAFYNLAILEKATEYGCSCHHMDEGFDTGPLVKVRRFAIDPRKETAWSLESRTQAEMIRLFLDFCDLAELPEPLPCQPQDMTRHRYLSREAFESLKRIPPEADGETVDRLARAFWYPPHKGAYLQVNGTDVEVVPESVKREVAQRLHADDLSHLHAVAAEYQPSVG